MLPNALRSTTANPAMKNSATPVITALIRSRITSESTAVISPPTNSTRPVPIRLRMPSTSVMMRDTSVPVLLAS